LAKVTPRRIFSRQASQTSHFKNEEVKESYEHGTQHYDHYQFEEPNLIDNKYSEEWERGRHRYAGNACLGAKQGYGIEGVPYADYERD